MTCCTQRLVTIRGQRTTFLRCRSPADPRCTCPRRAGAPWSWARARSAPRSPCCSPAAACAPRSRPARPSRRAACRTTARTPSTSPASSCRASCGSRASTPASAARTSSSSACPSRGLDDVIAGLNDAGLPRGAAVVSLAKGLVPPDGRAPSVLLGDLLGEGRVAVVGGPAHAREMVHEGAGLVAASANESLADAIAQVFLRAGVVCETSTDPVGVELAGAAKNAAALAAGATEAQGLNAAGAAAGHIFAEVWSYAAGQGAQAESFIGLAGTGDLVATALAPQSRNRRAGELLAEGVSSDEIPERIGQAVESFDLVPLLAAALSDAGIRAPVTDGLARAHRRRPAAREVGGARPHHRPGPRPPPRPAPARRLLGPLGRALARAPPAPHRDRPLARRWPASRRSTSTSTTRSSAGARRSCTTARARSASSASARSRPATAPTSRS